MHTRRDAAVARWGRRKENSQSIVREKRGEQTNAVNVGIPRNRWTMRQGVHWCNKLKPDCEVVEN